MTRLLVWASVLGSLLLVATFVPLGGRTVAERWKGAPSALAFAEQSGREIADVVSRLWGGKPEPHRPAPRSTPPGKPTPRVAAKSGTGAGKEAAAPQEHHTEADRNALDRIVAEHSGSSR